MSQAAVKFSNSAEHCGFKDFVLTIFACHTKTDQRIGYLQPYSRAYNHHGTNLLLYLTLGHVYNALKGRAGFFCVCLHLHVDRNNMYAWKNGRKEAIHQRLMITTQARSGCLQQHLMSSVKGGEFFLDPNIKGEKK